MLRAAISTTLLVLACTPTPSGPASPDPQEPEPREPAPPLTTELQRDVSEPEPEPEPQPDPAASCPEPPPREGFERCDAVELTGAAPCEEICRRPRSSAPTTCCPNPTDVIVFAGAAELLSVAACERVPPECADVHGHGNMDAALRVLTGPPVELVVVEGGCEMRAMAHGYVPPGVAAWTGCVHQRYRWDGARLVLVQD